jgi:UDP-N-acetylmuramyl pentapeptide phosphotransferase/UDP-N-acetylglucosamine-1-phosphate transferase
MLLALRPVAQVAGLIDKPGGRKTHRGEVPVVGGIAMFAGLLVAAPGLAGLGFDGAAVIIVSTSLQMFDFLLTSRLPWRWFMAPNLWFLGSVTCSVWAR